MATRKLPNIIIQEEFEKLHDYVYGLEQREKKSKKKLQFRKYRLAMLLAFESGLRISEIIGYQSHIPPLSNLCVEASSLRVVSGKGGKDRIVPRPKRMNTNALKLLPIQLHRRTLQHFITTIGQKVLKKHITFHSLRHGFGSHLAGEGRPLHEIQLLMGHARLDTTGIYLHANTKKAIDGARDVF